MLGAPEIFKKAFDTLEWPCINKVLDIWILERVLEDGLAFLCKYRNSSFK